MSAWSRIFRKIGRMNIVMTVVILLLMTIGILFIYSASGMRDEPSIRLLWRKQLCWGLGGLVCYFAMAVFDYRRLRDSAVWFYILVLLLLVAVLIVGTRLYGAKRWLMFFGTGIQPSELAKLSVIMLVGMLLGQEGADNSGMKKFWEIIGLVALPAGLILIEPDLGTTMVLVPIVLAMLYTAGASRRILISIVAGGVVAVCAIIGALMLPEKMGLPQDQQERILRYTGLTDYQRERILVFLDSNRDPMGAGWNKRQSAIAVGSGGLTGKGFKQGTQNMLGFLPRTVAPTDFIFSVITEEMGFLGSVAVLGLFAVMLIIGMQAGLAGADRFGRLLCVGVMTMLFSHVVINVSMTIGLMPVTGLPLPLISYGGTFLLSTMVALGIVQSVYIRRAGV